MRGWGLPGKAKVGGGVSRCTGTAASWPWPPRTAPHLFIPPHTYTSGSGAPALPMVQGRPQAGRGHLGQPHTHHARGGCAGRGAVLLSGGCTWGGINAKRVIPRDTAARWVHLSRRGAACGRFSWNLGACGRYSWKVVGGRVKVVWTDARCFCRSIFSLALRLPPSPRRSAIRTAPSTAARPPSRWSVHPGWAGGR